MAISATKRIAKNLSWLAAGEYISKGIEFLMILYLARVLGTAAFGFFNFALAFLAYMVIVVDFGLALFGIREIAKGQELTERLVVNIFVMRFLLASLLFLFAGIILFFLPVSQEVKLLFGAVFLYLFCRALDPSWVFQGLEKMQYLGAMKILTAMTSFFFAFLFIKSADDLLKLPLMSFMVAALFAVIFLFILHRYFASFSLAHVSLKSWKSYFYQAMPLGASIIFVQIYYNLDSIMLGIMKNVEMVGLYNAAYKLFFAFLSIFALWQTAVFPEVSRRVATDKKKAETFLRKYLKLSLLAGVPVCFAVTILSPLLLKIMFGPEYVRAAIILQILVWNIIPIIISGTYGTLILISLGKNIAPLQAVAGGALVNIALNFLLIPPFGFVGASIATLLAELVVAGIAVSMAFKYFNLHFFSSLFRPVLISLLSISGALVLTGLFPSSSFIYQQIILGAIFFLFYFIIILLLGDFSFLRDFTMEVLSGLKRAEA